MIETDEQRRWWFATHPEYSWSYREGKTQRQPQEQQDDDKVRPEDVDAYVDNALQYVHGTVADLLKSVKRNFGTEAYSQEPRYSEPAGWGAEAGGRTGGRQGPRPGRGSRRGLDIRDWIHMSRQERQARARIEAELEQAGANSRDYRLTSFAGQFVAQRDRLFDPNQVDHHGRTNVQRMERGQAPFDREENAIVLHHANQRSEGPIIELTRTEHRSIRVRQEPSEIDRTDSAAFRETYWQTRAASVRSPEPELFYYE
jgi:hypothetical protein